MKSIPKPIFVAIGIIGGLCLITLLLYFAVIVPSFGMWFYSWQYNVNDTYNVVNMTHDDLHEVTRHMIRYMQGHLDRDYGLQIITTVGGQPRYFFSDIEIRHMVDVYDLFAIGFIIRNVATIALLLCTAFFAIFGRDRLHQLFVGLQIASVAVFATLATTALLIAINWHRAFVIFHEIFFDNDYWILDRRVDLLINIVPYDFFITLSTVIGGFFAAGLAIIFGASALLKRRVSD
ncbi:MAG: TIGR01906 family membrane protein [Defluviitaleaceae bacterium]|nr:TIGR01906 family membrane protein [Defluviitaleaceae bacterium]